MEVENIKIIKDYNDFYFNGKRLSDMKGIIINQYEAETNVTPSLNIETIKIPGRDGEIPISSSYEPRTWSLDIYFEELVDLRYISGWLGNKEEKDFYYIGDNVKIKALITDSLESNISFDAAGSKFCGTLTLKLTAYNPYYELIDPISYQFDTVGLKEFSNEGNINSFPNIYFQVIGTQNIRFSLNGKLFEIKNVKEYLEIDSNTRSIKDANGNRRLDFSSEGKRVIYFPILKSGDNNFELVLGSIKKVIIRCNSIFI